MGATWLRSMRSSLDATLGHPQWWPMALAAFLVRGGIFLVLLPIVSLPTPGQLANALAPTINVLAFEGLTVPRVLASLLLAAGLTAVVATAGLVGAWIDRALVRDAAEDEDLALTWRPGPSSIRLAFGLRLAAHVPTMLAIAYATVRLLYAAYDELLSPGDAGIPIVWRVIDRAPEALGAVFLAWLAGETIAGMAARRTAAGQHWRAALGHATVQLLRPRRLATVVATTAIVGGVVATFIVGIGAAWEQVRTSLSSDATTFQLAAALLVLVASWILGIAILGAALAWRATVWTAELVPPLTDAAALGALTPADGGVNPVAP